MSATRIAFVNVSTFVPVLANTVPLVVKQSNDVAALLLVSADQPSPRFVLAVAALVAPVPPETMDKAPVIFVALILVRLTALLDAKLESTKDEG